MVLFVLVLGCCFLIFDCLSLLLRVYCVCLVTGFLVGLWLCLFSLRAFGWCGVCRVCFGGLVFGLVAMVEVGLCYG